MKLYVCWGTWRGPTPWPLPGVFNLTPGRCKVKELTGQTTVPVLVTEEGEVVAGSTEIAIWARHSAQ